MRADYSVSDTLWEMHPDLDRPARADASLADADPLNDWPAKERSTMQAVNADDAAQSRECRELFGKCYRTHESEISAARARIRSQIRMRRLRVVAAMVAVVGLVALVAPDAGAWAIRFYWLPPWLVGGLVLPPLITIEP